MGEKASGSLGPRGGRRGWDHCFRAKPSEDTEELTLRQVLRNETGTVKLRRSLGLKSLGVSRGQGPLERKNLVLGVWVEGVQEGSQQFSSFQSSRSTCWLCFPLLVLSPTIPARDAPSGLPQTKQLDPPGFGDKSPEAREHGDTPEKVQVRTEQPPEWIYEFHSFKIVIWLLSFFGSS